MYLAVYAPNVLKDNDKGTCLYTLMYTDHKAQQGKDCTVHPPN